MIDENPRYWKYCEQCGKDLKRYPPRGPDRYDRINKTPYYRIIVACPEPELNNDHTWSSYETKDPTDIEIKEVEF